MYKWAIDNPSLSFHYRIGKTFPSVLKVYSCIHYIYVHEGDFCTLNFQFLNIVFQNIYSSLSVVFSTNNTDRQDITEILLEVALNTF